MSELINVLIGEANKLNSKISLYEDQLETMNKGTIFVRKMRNSSFVYRKYKIDGKVYSTYLGSINSKSAKEGIRENKEYKHIKECLKESKKKFDELKKVIKNLNHKKPNFFNAGIKINFDISKKMKILISEAEEADLLNDYGKYMNWCYAIDAQAKKEVTHHIISEGQWNKLLRRYSL